MDSQVEPLGVETLKMLIKKRRIALWTFTLDGEAVVRMLEYDAKPIGNHVNAWQRLLTDMEMQVNRQLGVGLLLPWVAPYRTGRGKVIFYTRSLLDDAFTFDLDVYFKRTTQGDIVMKKKGWMDKLIIARRELEPVMAIARQQPLNTRFALLHPSDQMIVPKIEELLNRAQLPIYIDSMIEGRGELWSIVNADQRREPDELTVVERLARVDLYDAHHNLFVDQRTPDDQMTDMFLKVRKHMMDQHQLELNLNGDEPTYALLMRRYDTIYPYGTCYIFLADRRQRVQVHVTDHLGKDLHLWTTLDVSQYARWSPDPTLSVTTWNLSSGNAETIERMAHHNIEFDRGQSLISLLISDEGRISSSTIINTVPMPDAMPRSHKMILMLLYGAYYAEQGQSSPMLVNYWKVGWHYAYVWQNTMVVTKFMPDDVIPTASTLIDLFIGGPSRPRTASIIFDLGPRPYLMNDPVWLMRRLRDIQPRDAITFMPKLPVEPWDEMGMLMDVLPNRPEVNLKLMQNLIAMTGPNYVHLERTTVNLDTNRLLKRQLVAVPAWLGPHAPLWFGMHDAEHVGSKYPSDGVRSSIKTDMGDFVNLPLDDPYDLETQKACAFSIIRLLAQAEPSLIKAWPRSGDPLWALRIAGFVQDLKFTFSLESLINPDMSYLINEMAYRRAMPTIEWVQLTNNASGQPMVYAEQDALNPLSFSVQPGQGWLIKRAQSLTDYALVLCLSGQRYVSPVMRNGSLVWINMNESQLIDLYQSAFGQMESSSWMGRHWLDRHDVFANMFWAARHLSYPDQLEQMML